MPVQSAGSRAAGYRWYVCAEHEATGMSYDESLCHKARSLTEARAWIDEDAARTPAPVTVDLLGEPLPIVRKPEPSIFERV